MLSLKFRTHVFCRANIRNILWTNFGRHSRCRRGLFCSESGKTKRNGVHRPETKVKCLNSWKQHHWPRRWTPQGIWRSLPSLTLTLSGLKYREGNAQEPDLAVPEFELKCQKLRCFGCHDLYVFRRYRLFGRMCCLHFQSKARKLTVTPLSVFRILNLASASGAVSTQDCQPQKLCFLLG
jgi:hypothetical protein